MGTAFQILKWKDQYLFTEFLIPLIKYKERFISPVDPTFNMFKVFRYAKLNSIIYNARFRTSIIPTQYL